MKRTIPLHIRIVTMMVVLLATIVPTYTYASQALTISEIESKTNNADIQHILDGDPSTEWHSGDDLVNDSYIDITLAQELTLADDDALVFKITRTKDITTMQPTALILQKINDDGTLSGHLAHVYFFYRGAGTVEFSERVYLNGALKGSSIKKMRLTVLTTNSYTTTTTAERAKKMCMAGLELFKVKKHEWYSATQLDRLHLTTDYDFSYIRHNFEFTQGILDSRNRQYTTDARDWCDWTGWTDGRWTKDAALLQQGGVEMPDFAMLSMQTNNGLSDEKQLAINNRLAAMLPAGQTRQNTHTTEHVLYAIPGDIIALDPYYAMAPDARSGYKINFSHWYDWRTGGHVAIENGHGETVRLLDLAIDPEVIRYTEDHGYFGGHEVRSQGYRDHYLIYTPEDWITFANKVNENKSFAKLTAEVMRDIDFTGYDNVPSIGPDYDRAFAGKIDGRGHTFRNLVMNRPTENQVAIICRASDGAEIRNLIIDESCSFTGNQNVAALIGSIHTKTSSGSITISNVDIRAKVTGNWRVSGVFGIIQPSGSNYLKINITDCHIGGKITANNTNTHALTAVGNFNDNTSATGHRITNTYLDPEFSPYPARYPIEWEGSTNWTVLDQQTVIRTNSYSVPGDYSFKKLPTDYKTNPEGLRALLGSGWRVADGELLPVVNPISFNYDGFSKWFSAPDYRNSAYGTVGTFFYPRNPLDVNDDHELPMPEGQNEYVIAADFGQSFVYENNVGKVDGKETIIEPIIQFRHVFRIRDGQAFAEDFSGDADRNANYVKRNKIVMTARADIPFQTRLNEPVPTEQGGQTMLYYKAGDNDYRRVGQMDIKVYEVALDGTETEVSNHGFYFSESFEGSGIRKINDIEYRLCNGKSNFNRVLKCDMPLRGHYRIAFIGKDVEGHPIEIYNSGGRPLIVCEYDITFHNDDLASFVREEEFYTAKNDKNEYKYRHAWPEVISKRRNIVLGDAINFDELAVLENTTSASALDGNDYLRGSGIKRWFKWPLELSSADYAFGYDKATNEDHNVHYDYNQYMLASHSDVVQWKGQASLFPFNTYDKYYQSDENNGLYDRLYYESRRMAKTDPSTPQQHGYFYYINAATDPGKICTLDAKSICMGSTIHVSAWIAEFSGGEETANVAFKFNAVLNDEAAKRDPNRYAGQRINLHTFVTGYVDKDKNQVGRWMNAYYSFTPLTVDFDLQESEIAFYELQLINECKNSHGADYAIDDIALYIENPSITAEQLSMLCSTDENEDAITEIQLKMSVPFDNMLQKLSLPEGTDDDYETPLIAYTILDKEEYDNAYNPEVANSKRQAYNASHQRIDYNHDGSLDDYGYITFDTRFAKNDDYNRIFSTQAMKDTKDYVRYLCFNIMPEVGTLDVDKEYYIVMNLLQSLDDLTSLTFGVDVFDVSDNCTPTGVFVIQPTTVVKLDGYIEDISRTDYCENMQPVVQLDLRGEDLLSKEISVVEHNAYFDWYAGTEAEYNAEERDGMILRDVLDKFRTFYPDSSTVDNITPNTEMLTAEMIEYIKDMATIIPEGEATPKLRLLTKSYVFPPLKIPAGEDFAVVTVLALPIEREHTKYRICADPTPVSLTVRERSPLMRHGILGIDYPEHIVDVPVRTSLKQLADASIERGTDYSTHALRFNVPIRSVQMSTVTEAGGMRLRSEGSVEIREMFLVATDDPEYEDLHTTNEAGEQVGLQAVGEITGLTAEIATPDVNIFNCVFYSDFKFKEGYTYSFRFPFEEDTANPNEKCPGQEIFTIKVVPAYLKWTGAEGTNYNNDDNWRRVVANEVYMPKDETNANFVDGNNSRIKAFAPLDFTKILIGKGTDTTPELVLNELTGTPVSVKGSDEQYSMYPSPTTATAAATPDIEYDMAGFYGRYLDAEGVFCRPWYANTCSEVHFLPQSQILGQNYLVYNRAWVDFEMSANYWHLVSSPLKETFAGEFYLPKAGARQETPMFDPITYSTTDNNRFMPAVYQHSWNTSRAIVYELAPGTNRNVCVKAGWSNVYNDVTERYGSGYGFSIKTDPTGTGVADGGDILFRLPKHDDSYAYFEKEKPNGSDDALVHDLNRTEGEHYRLNDVQGTLLSRTQTETRYFLVGNPFMAHLDMSKFLTHPANAAKIKPQYSVASDGSQQQAVLNSETGTFDGPASGFVAPLQSFFVEIRPGAQLSHEGTGTVVLSLEYTADMACLHRDGSEPAAIDSRSLAERRVSVTAFSGDKAVSQSLLRINPDVDNAYDELRDVAALDNTEGLGIDALVYMMSGDMATSILTRNAIEGTSLGVVAHANTSTTLRFDGIYDADELALYNAGDDSYTDLYDGKEVTVCGSNAGLYIVKRKGIAVDDATEISYSIVRDVVTVIAPAADADLHVTVADLQGRIYYNADTVGRAQISLPTGMYVINAYDPAHELTAKIMVR